MTGTIETKRRASRRQRMSLWRFRRLQNVTLHALAQISGHSAAWHSLVERGYTECSTQDVAEIKAAILAVAAERRTPAPRLVA